MHTSLFYCMKSAAAGLESDPMTILVFFVFVSGSVNRNFSHITNEMGPSMVFPQPCL